MDNNQNRKIRRMTKTKKDVIIPSNERDEIIRFTRTLGIVILILVAAYFFTRIFVTKDLLNKPKNSEEETSYPVSINYEITPLGAIFTRPYTEYYVLVYSSKNKSTDSLSVIASKYKAGENGIKLYYADLASPFNKSFYSETESTPDADNALDLKVKDSTLIKIKDGKIIKFIEDKDLIIKELEVSE